MSSDAQPYIKVCSHAHCARKIDLRDKSKSFFSKELCGSLVFFCNEDCYEAFRMNHFARLRLRNK